MSAPRILRAPTPPAWAEAAAARWPELLVDHANCEKKAASSALALVFAYPEDSELSLALARLPARANSCLQVRLEARQNFARRRTAPALPGASRPGMLGCPRHETR